MKIKKGDTPELKLKKMDGSDFDLNNFKGKKVYLKYMRFASCMFCNLEVNHLKNKHSEFGQDFEIVLVFHSSVEFLNKQMKKHGPLPFTVLADPDYSYYKKYEIERSMAKLMNALSKNKINPLIGAAGVSAVPMAARVVNKVGLENDSQNFLLMHAMGPNVAGVIGSAVAAGVMIQLLA